MRQPEQGFVSLVSLCKSRLVSSPVSYAVVHKPVVCLQAQEQDASVEAPVAQSKQLLEFWPITSILLNPVTTGTHAP